MSVDASNGGTGDGIRILQAELSHAGRLIHIERWVFDDEWAWYVFDGTEPLSDGRVDTFFRAIEEAKAEADRLSGGKE